ncbi:cysteine-rich CWC family protein [Halosquirtibacter laminarini]|uniref:Cysteine-rich CWC family protein n=1 Tax=Halosquirtibacter laminarini TaxID=3374600 RepID=A0AC61NIP2_9BACT|nr:cysteine-rich CWC family protein [Prolixibacteraceae bacterium]
MQKRCPRCHETFECCHDKIESCWCSKVKIDKVTYHYISNNFNDCLCKKCTEALQSSNNQNIQNQ